MENTDKMQNKCALPGNKFRDGTEFAWGKFISQHTTGHQIWIGFDGSLLTSSGKSEGNDSAFASCNRDFLPTIESVVRRTPFAFHYLLHKWWLSKCSNAMSSPNVPICKCPSCLRGWLCPSAAVQQGGKLSFSTDSSLRLCAPAKCVISHLMHESLPSRGLIGDTSVRAHIY